MAYTPAGSKSVRKYTAKNYDQVKLLVKKGQREVIKSHATKQGYSTNAYINQLIAKDIGSDFDPISDSSKNEA